MLEIRPLIPDEWRLLKEVRLKALQDAPEAFGTTLTQALAWDDAQWQENAQRFAVLPPATSYFAFSNNFPFGMVNCFMSLEDRQVAELTAFWVAPERRGLGIEAALVASAAEWASTQGIIALQAWVGEDNHRAIGFYRRVGFSEVGPYQTHTSDSKKQIILLTKNPQL